MVRRKFRYADRAWLRRTLRKHIDALQSFAISELVGEILLTDTTGTPHEALSRRLDVYFGGKN
jgi:hypothetical protein